MKTKLLSLLLVITLLAVTVSTGLPTILAADENLITNGDFADYSGGKPTGWNTNFTDASGGAISVQEDVQITDSLTANAVKLTTTGNNTSKNHFYHTSKIKIEKNASYTMTFWVKVKNIEGVTFYMYEPDYIDKNGEQKNNWSPQEGANIYTYSHDNGTTRVIRTDIKHSWTIAQTGNSIDRSAVSMAISRVNNVNQVLTPDYPNHEKEGEWLQVVHKFSTANIAAHQADVTYAISFPSAPNGELWVADVKMNVVKSEIDEYYNAAVNNDRLGCTSKDVPLINGKTAEITAEPYGENIFDGWFVDSELVSKEKTLTFTYDSNNPPKYVANFTKAEWGIDGSFETGYTNNKLLAESPDVAYGTTDSAGLWNEALFKTSSKDGNNMFFIDSEWSKHGKAVATTEYAHSGKFAIKNAVNHRALGYKITGLNKDTDYKVSLYAMTLGTTNGVQNTLGSVIVTGSNTSCVFKNTSTNVIAERKTDSGALAYLNTANVDCKSKWQKVEVTFNSKENTEVIVWVRANGANTATYLDDYAIARIPAALKPAVNDSNLGFAAPAEGIVCLPGDEVTFTATPLDGNKFEGWYVGDKLISDKTVFTFSYTDEYKGITARFKAGETAVPNASFEDASYTDGQVLAQATHSQPTTPIDQTDWTVDSWKNTTKDDIHYIESNNGGTYRKAYISTTVAHSGKKSLVLNGLYGYVGKAFTGLKKDTNYAISFYGMITGATDATFGNLKITKAGETIMNANGAQKASNEFVATLDKSFAYYNEWGKVTFEFNSGDNTDIILWIYHNKLGLIHLDDFAIYEPCKASISADLGGTVSSNLNSTSIPIGSMVQLDATPLEGNTFVGWYDVAGNLISDKADYSFKAKSSFAYIAKFNGYNKPATDMFAVNGNDGTFENGSVPGWFFRDNQYDCVWCGAQVSDKLVYEGEKALQIHARYRNALLPLTGLIPNAQYRLSFYINQPDTNEKAKVGSLAIIGENDVGFSNAGIIFTSAKEVKSNSGWNRIDLYFNSGDNTAATFAIRFEAETLDGIKDKLFIDNLSLYRYAASEDVLNGSLDEEKSGWIGDGTVVTEDDNKVLKLNKNESVYQNIVVNAYSSYTVSFKAKGKLTAAAQDFAKFDLNVKNFISSKSYIDVDGSEWTEYSYKVYTGVNKSINLVFKALEDGTMVDDLVITKDKQTAGSVVEYIDFDSERFDLTSATDDSIWSLYTAAGDNDPYVYSGNRSLKFTYNELLSSVECFFNEAYLSYQPGLGNSLKISMKYKIVDGKEGGFAGLAPDYSGSYGADTGFEHMSKTDEWQTVIFYVNNSTHEAFKSKINSIAYNTTGDFYVDDIVIEITPPMVTEENSKITYCERLYNAVDNEGFENPASDKDWANLPTTAKIVKGKALKGDYFLRAEGGTHYVLPVTIEPNKEYYFAASVRGNAKTVGSIGIAIDKEGNSYYQNRDAENASIIEFESDETKWKRKAFKFTTDGDVVYLTIDVKSGALDIDSVMLFTSEYGYRYDPNDYTNYVPYDYDNLKSASTLINGGFGDQPYYKGTAGEEGDIIYDDNVTENEETETSPSTGDSLTLPVLTIVLAVVASAALMAVRKRKEGAENA